MLSNRATDQILARADDYVALLFGRRLAFEPADAGLLPFFLADKYAVREGRLLDRRLVFLVVSAEAMDPPATIAKHVALARAAFDDAVMVVLTDALSAHNRQRLVAQGVNFIVPGNQLFLPELGLDLREHFRAGERRGAERLTPVAQVMVIAALLHEDLDGMSPKALAERFDYTPMSTGRAVDELEQFDIVDVRPRGRELHIAFRRDGADLWRHVRPLLRSPVRLSRLVRRWPGDVRAPLAGESALSDYTDLGAPRRETRAVAARSWKSLVRQFELELADAHDPGAVEVQTWTYDPRILCHAGPAVDRLSLYLSLEDRVDERLDQAAEALLEPFKWS